MSLLDDDDAPAQPTITIMHLCVLAARGDVVTYKLDGPGVFFEHAACTLAQIRDTTSAMSKPTYYNYALEVMAVVKLPPSTTRCCDHCKGKLSEPNQLDDAEGYWT